MTLPILKKLRRPAGSDNRQAAARHADRAVVAGRGTCWPEEHLDPALARRGTRPRLPHDQRTKYAYIFGAIWPEKGKGAGLAWPGLLRRLDRFDPSYRD